MVNGRWTIGWSPVETIIIRSREFSNEIQWKWFGAIWFYEVFAGFCVPCVCVRSFFFCEWVSKSHKFRWNILRISIAIVWWYMFPWFVLNRMRITEYFQISKHTCFAHEQNLIVVIRKRRNTTRESDKSKTNENQEVKPLRTLCVCVCVFLTIQKHLLHSNFNLQSNNSQT